MGTEDRPTSTGQSVGRQRSRAKPKGLLQVAGVILLCVLIYGLSHKLSTSNSISATQQSSETVSAPQPESVRPTIPPPKFRIYKFKDDGVSPISVVVPVQTTDEQLKSLLWFFREKVRSHEFKSIGITEEKDGIFVLYRGEKCANEEFIDTNGPCGYGEHDDASYQWGIDGDYDKDTGSIRINGDDTVVFDYNDGWRVSPAVQAKLNEQDKTGEEARQLFAQELQQRLTSMGYDITVWSDDHIDGPGLLTLDSEIFKDTATRVQFVNNVLPAWKKDLCNAGFQQVNLRRGASFELNGQRFSLGCKH